MKSNTKYFGWLFALITIALLLAAPAFAADQFRTDATASPSGYVHAPLTTNTGAILIPGSSTTNFPATAQYILPVPASGFGLYFRTGGTNAASTTNLTVVLEGVMFPSSGVTQVVDNATWVARTPTTATDLPAGYDYLTNWSGNITAGTELLRVDGVRVRSIQNTNLASIWISNMFQIR